MSGDMRVKLTLDLVNRLSPGAKAAARDIKTIQQAAGELKREKGGEALAEGLKKVAPAGRQAAREVRAVKAEAKGLAAERGPQQLAGGLDKAAGSAKRLRRELDATKRAQRDFARNSPLAPSALGMPRHRRGGAEAGGTGSGGAGGLGLGAAAAAAGRNAFLPLAAAYGGYRGVSAGVRGTVGQSISFEKAMADVRKKVDGMDDPAQLAAMEKSISKWAIAYGRTREEVASLVAEAGAGGVSQADMPEFARINLAASTAWDVSASQAGNALAKIRAATQWSNKELEIFVDKVNALADAGSAKEMDVVEMFQRAGAAAKAAGVDFDTSLAFLTAMNNVAIAPEVAARGFAAFSSKLRTAANQGKKVKEGLGMLGLTPKGVEQGMRADARGTMIGVLEKLEAHADKAAVAIKIFGQEWWDEVARAGQALPEIRKALAIVGDPKKYVGSAMGNLNIELSTTDKHLKRLSAAADNVGDKLGRWALPAINEGIERVIAGMDELERRAAQLKQGDDIRDKANTDRVLSPQERARIAEDDGLARDVQKRADRAADRVGREANIKQKALSDQERQQLELRRTRLSEEEARLQGEIDAIRARSRDAAAAARPIAELEKKQIAARRQRAELDAALGRSPKAATGPADREDRESDRMDAVERRRQIDEAKERVIQAELRIRRLEALAAGSSNPANRAGFLSDRTPYLVRQAQAEADFRNRVAPTLGATGNFNATGRLRVQGKGWKDSVPANWAPGASIPATGSGRLGFGLGGGVNGAGKVGAGAAWAEKVRSDFDIDLGEAGMTMMERLNAGLRSGAAGVESTAAGVKTGIEAALSGTDLAAAGQQAMASYAAGLRAGAPAAVAAAEAAAAGVKGALGSGGGRRALQGALHDGVD